MNMMMFRILSEDDVLLLQQFFSLLDDYILWVINSQDERTRWSNLQNVEYKILDNHNFVPFFLL